MFLFFWKNVRKNKRFKFFSEKPLGCKKRIQEILFLFVLFNVSSDFFAEIAISQFDSKLSNSLKIDAFSFMSDKSHTLI